METLLRKLTEFYEHHHIAPGIQVAWLAEREMFYGAIHLFPNGISSRMILVKSMGISIESVCLELHQKWGEIINPTNWKHDERIGWDIPTTEQTP